MLDRLAREERPVGTLGRDVDDRKSGNRLRLAVLEHLKIFLLQVADEGSALIGDDGIDLDVVDLDLEGRLLGGRRLRLPGAERRAGREDEQRCYSCM